MAAAVVTAGCIPAAGPSHIPYVILPYLASLLAAASVVWLMCRLTAGGDPLPDYVHAATVKQFGLRGTLALVCSAAALVCEGIYLALNGAGDRLAGSIGFLVCEGVAALCALWWKISTQKLRW